MTGKMRYHERGSAVIMAVGLLVILGLLGTTFYVITKLDRNEAESLATAAPMKNVAAGVLEQICAERVKDLHLDSAGRVYGRAGISTQTYDAPHETVDKALACVRPINFLWRHVSNLPGDLAGAGDGIWVDGTILTGPFAGKYVSELVDVNGNQLHDWVDTDGTAFEVPPGSGKWYDGDALVCRVGETLTVLNSRENEDVTESFAVPLKRGPLAAISGTIGPHAYMVGRIEEGGRRLWLQANSEYPDRDTRLSIAWSHKPRWQVVPVSATREARWDEQARRLVLRLSHKDGAVEVTASRAGH